MGKISIVATVVFTALALLFSPEHKVARRWLQVAALICGFMAAAYQYRIGKKKE